MSSVIENIRQRIGEKMDELGWDQTFLGKQAKVDQGTISKILSGETTNPRITTLIEIAQALGVTVSDLTGEKELPKEEPPMPGPIPFFKRYYNVDDNVAQHLKAIVDSALELGGALRSGIGPALARKSQRQKPPHST